MEFREKGEKELAVLRESARVFLEAVAAGSGGDHHDDRDVTTEKSEVLAAIDGMELDFKDLSELVSLWMCTCAYVFSEIHLKTIVVMRPPQ